MKKSRFRESSALLEIFTPLLGRHSVIAKGMYRKKKNFSSHLEPLSLNNIEFFYKENRQIQTITKADLIYYPENILGDLETFEYAAKSIRILRRQKYPTESVKSLYKTIKSSIIRFNENKDAERIYLDFLRSYLFLEGHLNEMYVSDENLEDAYDARRIKKTIVQFERVIGQNEI